jgi:hypothetical protein
MKTKPLSVRWQGTFIELCLNRISQTEKARIDAVLTDSEKIAESAWYDNQFLLKSLFGADNWWSVDNIDHSMGLVFSDRSLLDSKLSTIRYTLAGAAVTVDPDALQLSFYAPEPIEAPLAATDQILCHGTLRQVEMQLDVDIEPPFDPSLMSTLSRPLIPACSHSLSYTTRTTAISSLTWTMTDTMISNLNGEKPTT